MRATSTIRPAGAAEHDLTPTPDAVLPAPAAPIALHPTVRAVLDAAQPLAPEPGEAMAWYREAPIAELDHLTAAELVASGRAGAVLAFLRSVIDGRRD